MSDDLLARLAAGPHLPAAFVRRVTELAPGASLAYDEAEWRGAVVLVREGVVQLQLHSGVSSEFVARDLLWLAGLGVRSLHNPGPLPAALVSVRRRAEVTVLT